MRRLFAHFGQYSRIRRFVDLADTESGDALNESFVAASQIPGQEFS